MRLSPLTLLLVLPFLSACESSSPKAPSGSAAATPAKPVVTKAPVVAPAGFPNGARPMLGTWAPDLAACRDPAKVITVAAATYSVGGKSCDLALKDNKDGTFAATCGKQTMTLTPIFGPTGEGIRIAAGESKPANVFRCSR
jgi:hypothetical protein